MGVVLKEYDRLQFSPSVVLKRDNKNKKAQREIHKQMLDRGAGTKSQQGLTGKDKRKQRRKSKSRERQIGRRKNV